MIRTGHEIMERDELQGKKNQELLTEISRLRDQMQFLIKERAEDLQQIGELLKESAKRTITELLQQTEENMNARCTNIDNQIH